MSNSSFLSDRKLQVKIILSKIIIKKETSNVSFMIII